MDVISKFSLPDVPVIFIVKDNIKQHQHDHRLVSKHWMTVLEYLQMETKSLIVRDWHELNHGAKTELIFLKLRAETFYLKATPEPARTWSREFHC